MGDRLKRRENVGKDEEVKTVMVSVEMWRQGQIPETFWAYCL